VKCSPAIKEIGSIKKEWTIHNGIDLDRFMPESSKKFDIRSELNLHKNTILIISVGNLRQQKNHLVSIETIYHLREKFKLKNIHLLLVGKGIERDNLINYARELDLSDRVHLLGARNDIEKLLYNCDIFISTSLWEGLPLAVIEAFASGIHSVISPITEHEIIGQDVADNYFPKENSGQSFAESIDAMLKTKSEFDHYMTSEKRKDTLKMYSISSFTDSYEMLYRSVLKN
jgi:glycosyltransferase involved in cell wall biosynthesis